MTLTDRLRLECERQDQRVKQLESRGYNATVQRIALRATVAAWLASQISDHAEAWKP